MLLLLCGKISLKITSGKAIPVVVSSSLFSLGKGCESDFSVISF